MAHSQFDQFLREATYPARGSDLALRGDSFYGLYTSWCCISCRDPEEESVFWAAMNERIGPGEGLGMTGPAAGNYFLNSYRPLL
ncbi:MAG: hypothetical protein ACLGIS_09915 [Actinomycetes bacterium]